MKIRKYGNYGYSLGEAAERFGLDVKEMIEFVRKHYRELNLRPICVLCDTGSDSNRCPEKREYRPGFELWHCDTMTLSAETIEEYRLPEEESVC